MINQTWKSKADYRNRDWAYTPAASTNVAKTIERVLREMAELGIKPKIVRVKKVSK